MALFDVDKIATNFLCQPCGRQELIFDPSQITIGKKRERIVNSSARRFVDGDLVEKGVMHDDLRATKTVPSRVSQLQANHQVIVRAIHFVMSLATTTKHLFHRRGGSIVQP